jgi:hypothetical protein
MLQRQLSYLNRRKLDCRCLVIKVKVTLRLAISQSSLSRNQSQSHIATGCQSVSKSWCRVPSGTHDQVFSYYYVTVTVLFLWCALCDEKTGLSFVIAAGSCQLSLSRVRVPWGSRPYFTVSDLRLPFRRLLRLAGSWSSLHSLGTDSTENIIPLLYVQSFLG